MTMRKMCIGKSITPRDDLQEYLNDIATYPLLTIQEETKLSALINNPATDPITKKAAVEKMVNSNLRFVVSVAKQYKNQGVAVPDLVNEGNIGLIKAAEKFDATRGFKFISYAVRWIRQAITACIAENCRVVRLPANRHLGLQQVRKTTAHLEQILQRIPTQEELAAKIMKNKDISDKDISMLIDLNNVSMIDLDAPMSLDDSNSLGENFAHPDQENSIEQNITHEYQQHYASKLLKILTTQQQNILKMYYGLSPYTRAYTLAEIADKYEINKETLRQTIFKSVKRMRNSSLGKQINGQVF